MHARRLPALILTLLCLLGIACAAPEGGGTLQYAILSHRRLPQDRFDEFQADYLLTARRGLQVALHAQGGEAPIKTWQIAPGDGLPRRFRWNGRVNGRPLDPGAYSLRFSVQGEEAVTRAFEVVPPEARPQLGLTEPADYLPEAFDDASVWRAMTAPVAVADVGDTAHQAIYDKPGRGRRKLGEVHGQTAGLRILRLDVEGHALVGAWAAEDGSYVEGYIPQRKLKMVAPDTRYGLLIDKNAQTLSVYEEGRRISTLAVSTGLMEKNKLFRETRAGAFLTQDRMLSFNSEGYRYDYGLRIDGGNLIHQAGYRLVDGEADFSDQLPALNGKASHGCVRVDPRPNAEGLDAFWLWTHIPLHTKVLVLDDPGARALRLQQIDPSSAPTATPAPTIEATPEPAPGTPAPAPSPEPAAQGLRQGSRGQAVTRLQDRLRALGYFQRGSTGNYYDETAAAVAAFQRAAGLEPSGQADPATLSLILDPSAPLRPTDSPAPTAAPTPVPPREAALALTFMGDCIIGSEEHSRAREDSFDALIAREGPAWPFMKLRDLLAEDDLSVINFEGVLKDDGREKQSRMHNFRGPEALAAVLPAGSIEVAGLANNHFNDYGLAGRRSTQAALDGAGVLTFGYGRLLTWDKDGVRLGFGGIRETTYKQGKARLGREIAQLREMGAHYIIYTCHFGKEYDPLHNALQTEMAHAAIEAGADLVVGAHPHVVQGVERYRDGLILYSLGNFVFGGNLELTEFGGLVARLDLRFTDQRLSETRLRLIPVLTTGARPANNFQPLPAQGEDKRRIMALIQADSGDLAIEEEMVWR